MSLAVPTNAGAATLNGLAFAVQPPNEVEANVAVSPRVRVDVQDTYGNLTPAGPVTLTLGQSPWPRTTLSGTVTTTATTGSAAFADLTLDRPAPALCSGPRREV